MFLYNIFPTSFGTFQIYNQSIVFFCLYCKYFWHCLFGFVAHFWRSWTCWLAVSLSHYADITSLCLFVTVSVILSVAVAFSKFFLLGRP